MVSPKSYKTLSNSSIHTGVAVKNFSNFGHPKLTRLHRLPLTGSAPTRSGFSNKVVASSLREGNPSVRAHSSADWVLSTMFKDLSLRDCKTRALKKGDKWGDTRFENFRWGSLSIISVNLTVSAKFGSSDRGGGFVDKSTRFLVLCLRQASTKLCLAPVQSLTQSFLRF